MSFINDLFKMHLRSKLPRLKKTLINPRDSNAEEDDLERLLRAGVARDRYAAQELLDHHQLSVVDVIRLLTKPQKPDWRKRLNNRLRSLDGSYAHNPHAAELRAIKRGERTSHNYWM